MNIMKRRCSSAADTSRTQGIVVTSPCIKGNHIGRMPVVRKHGFPQIF